MICRPVKDLAGLMEWANAPENGRGRLFPIQSIKHGQNRQNAINSFILACYFATFCVLRQPHTAAPGSPKLKQLCLGLPSAEISRGSHYAWLRVLFLTDIWLCFSWKIVLKSAQFCIFSVPSRLGLGLCPPVELVSLWKWEENLVIICKWWDATLGGGGGKEKSSASLTERVQWEKREKRCHLTSGTSS